MTLCFTFLEGITLLKRIIRIVPQVEMPTLRDSSLDAESRNADLLLRNSMIGASPCMRFSPMMLMFVYVFGGAIETGTANYVNYLLPGILLISIASGIAYTAYRLFLDVQKGIFERFDTMSLENRMSVIFAKISAGAGIALSIFHISIKFEK